MYHALLQLLLTLHIPASHDPSSELERLGTIAYAITVESNLSKGPMRPRVIAAHTLALWYAESRLSRKVHNGEPTRWGSDRGKAKCMGQLHSTGLLAPGEWETLAGTDLESTRNCARATMRVLQRFARWCRYDGSAESVARMYGAYGTGRGCIATAQGKRRAHAAQSILRSLR